MIYILFLESFELISPLRDLSDPYSGDPEISPVMKIVQNKPINAEPPGPLLTHSWLTPNGIWFIRNHHPVPKVASSILSFFSSFSLSSDHYYQPR